VFYHTIRSQGEGVYKEKGSRFIGITQHATTAQEVKAAIAHLRKEHPQAVHVCYAFRLGADKKHFRYTDDGEPSNSAGPPIFGQIQQANLTNCFVAVVRYYGGVKLGVGGLIQAYRQAAREAIEAAEIVETEDHLHYELHCNFGALPQVMAWLKKYKIAIKSQNYTDKHEITVLIPGSLVQYLEQLDKYQVVYTTLLNEVK
jgi:uncharacterized YigZ family protein